MNRLSLLLRRIEAPQVETLDGIKFSDCAIIEAEVDGTNLRNQDWFDSSLPVLSELIASANRSGNYLLFTCACGVADDGGWEEVRVLHDDDKVSWEFERDGLRTYMFDSQQYQDAITSLSTEAEALDSAFTLEPRGIVYPE